jgi:CMP-N-acetylneuraminic acid synthetase
VLFASSRGLVTFQKRPEKANDDTTSIGDVTYAIHDLYTAVADPADLTHPPKPLLYSRHEAPLRDAWQSPPTLQPPKNL